MPDPATNLDRYSWDAEIHAWYCHGCGCLVRDREPHDRWHRQVEALDYGDGR